MAWIFIEFFFVVSGGKSLSQAQMSMSKIELNFFTHTNDFEIAQMHQLNGPFAQLRKANMVKQVNMEGALGGDGGFSSPKFRIASFR